MEQHFFGNAGVDHAGDDVAFFGTHTNNINAPVTDVRLNTQPEIFAVDEIGNHFRIRELFLQIIVETGQFDLIPARMAKRPHMHTMQTYIQRADQFFYAVDHFDVGLLKVGDKQEALQQVDALIVEIFRNGQHGNFDGVNHLRRDASNQIGLLAILTSGAHDDNKRLVTVGKFHNLIFSQPLGQKRMDCFQGL